MKVNPLPSPRAREAIEHRVSALTRAETSRKMGISERRVSQLTAGADIAALRRKRWSDEATAASLSRQLAALESVGVGLDQDGQPVLLEPESAPVETPPEPAPSTPPDISSVADERSAPAPPEVPAPEVFAGHDSGPRPVAPAPFACDQCDWRGPSEAALDRHEENHPAAPARRRSREPIPRRYRHHPTARGEPIWTIAQDDAPAVLGYSGWHRKDGVAELDARGKPRSCAAAVQWLIELGDITEPDTPTAVTYPARLDGQRQPRAICFRRSYARGEIWDEPPESDSECRQLLLARFDEYFGPDRPTALGRSAFKISERDLIPT
jgi:hypothetical protein